MFVVGTAAEVTPIRSIDKITIGAGRRGPITEALQRAFFDVINGEVPDTHGWLTYVYPEESALRLAAGESGRAVAAGSPATAQEAVPAPRRGLEPQVCTSTIS